MVAATPFFPSVFGVLAFVFGWQRGMAAMKNRVRSDFLSEFFGFPLGGEKIYLSALANDRSQAGKYNPQQFASSDLASLEKFIGKFDIPGRGSFFCISPIRVDVGAVKTKENISSLRCLHADIDFKGIVGNRTSVLLALKKLKRQPTYVVFSGHGIHVYYLFSVALDANDENRAQVENAMRRLADVVGGDVQVCEIARVMRLPGTKNSKDLDAVVDCVVLESTGKRYTFSDLVTWLGVQEPVVERSVKTVKESKSSAVSTGGPVNFFAEYGKREYVGESLDIEAMLDGLVYPGNVHNTERDLMASLLSRGESFDNAVDFIIQGIQERIPESASWDWKREVRELRSLGIGWLVKHPDLMEHQQNPPDWLLNNRTIKTKVLPHAKVNTTPLKPPSPPSSAGAGASGVSTGTPRGAGEGAGARVLDWKPSITNGTARKMDEPENEEKNEDGTEPEGRVIDFKDRKDRVQLKSVEPRQPTPEIRLRFGEDLQNDAVEPPEWLVQNFIIKNALNGYFGDGGVGKDLTLMQLCIAMATGNDWLGMPVTPGRTLYINVEDNWKMLRYRQDAIQRYYGVDFNDFPERFVTSSMVGQSTVLATFDSRLGMVKPTPLYNDFRKVIDQLRPDLIVVGNRVNIFSVNQNEDAQARQCLELLNALILEFNTTIIMPGHVSMSGMANATGMSGSVQWSNGVRHRVWMSMLAAEGKESEVDEKDLRVRLLEVKKTNYSKHGIMTKIAWDDRYNMFIPITDALGFEAEAIPESEKLKKAEDEFIRMLLLFTETKTPVSDSNKRSPSYAPRIMAEDRRCTFYKRGAKKPNYEELEDAMDRLRRRGVIDRVQYGPQSDNTFKLVLIEKKRS